jgi:hypothetical protein
VERTQAWHKDRQDKLLKAKNDKTENYDECTFKPKISPTSVPPEADYTKLNGRAIK